MSERAPGGPKEGIYLDAAIERVRGEVRDRIDRISRTRGRLRIAAGIGLSAVLLAGGAGIAAALSSTPSASVSTVRVTITVGCDGVRTDAEAGFFTTTFTVPETDADRAHAEALCMLARQRLARDPEIVRRSPAELLVLTAVLVRQADLGSAPSGAADRPLDVEVLRTSFGTPESGR